ncbi:MAG: hypothetical protein JWO05_451 [Gemmatimonadetes bacterium]|nr:hypothetical protein [Gemmatimonadota bacterium]
MIPESSATTMQGTPSTTQPAAGHFPRTREELVDAALQMGVILIVAIIAYWIVRLVASRVEKLGARQRPSDTDHHSRLQRARTAATLLRNVGHVVLFVLVALMALRVFGFNTSPLLASAGVFGLAISFGSQSLVRDYVTGFFLQFEHQFAIDDVVRIGNVEGVVEDITLRLVYVREGSGALNIIPNGQITQVTNLSRSWGRVNVDVEVPWGSADEAEKALDAVAAEMAADDDLAPCFLEPPSANGIERLGAGTVTIRLTARVTAGARDRIAREFRQRAKRSLDAAKIPSVPYPAAIASTR